MSKFEKDMAGAAGILAGLFAPGNETVQKAVEHVNRRVGNLPDVPEGIPDDGNTIDVECVPVPPSSAARAPHAARPGAAAGRVFYCVFFADGEFTGHAYVDAGQAAVYMAEHEGAWMKPLPAGLIPLAGEKDFS